jgi:hypothetical protein
MRCNSPNFIIQDTISDYPCLDLTAVGPDQASQSAETVAHSQKHALDGVSNIKKTLFFHFSQHVFVSRNLHVDVHAQEI